MEQIYGLWHRGIKPSKWHPDYECCTEIEINRWKDDLEKEKRGEEEFGGYYGIGVYEWGEDE